MSYYYKARVLHNYDGDTIRMDVMLSPKIDHGFGIIDEPRWMTNRSFRLAYIDTPELGYRAKTEEEKVKAQQAKEFTTKWLQENADDQMLVNLETIKDHKGKYGRYLAIIWDAKQFTTLNEELVLAGFEKDAS